MKLPFISFLHTLADNFAAVPFSISSHLRGLHSQVLAAPGPAAMNLSFAYFSEKFLFEVIIGDSIELNRTETRFCFDTLLLILASEGM